MKGFRLNSSAAAPARTEPAWPQEDERSEGDLNQPWRAVVALVELLLACAAGWAATWAWSNVVTTITFETSGAQELTSRLFSGPWTAASIGFGLLAALLLVDAFRELTLAVRARHPK